MMDSYRESYQSALEHNAADEEKWRNFRKELVDTRGNLSEYVKQRCVNIIVPLGKKAMVRGTLLHTNEVTVSHGAAIFSDVSTAQAVDILDHRIKTCDERLEAFEKERELFSNKLNLPEDVFDEGEERFAEYHEPAEETEAWYRKHRESVRRMKREEMAEMQKMPNPDVFKKFDELEMMEELANEMESMGIDDDDKLSKILSGEMKIPESKLRVPHNLGSSPLVIEAINSNASESELLMAAKKSQEPEEAFKTSTEINNNDLITQNNHEIVELLKTYRSKIKDVLKNVRKDDERSLNLFLDLIELKDDIEDDIRKMNDDEDAEYSESEKDSDDETTVSIEADQATTRRKVRFSTSLEDVKLIENKEDYRNEPPSDSHTIQIHFQHSDARFSGPSASDDVIAHPGEIHKVFTPPAAPVTATKSILKHRHQSDLTSPEEPPPPAKKVFHSDFQPVGDVTEHEPSPMDVEENVVEIAAKDDPPKKISKFRQMRLKS